ncbi:MAG TPA: HEXXH motif domain-containing protein [Trebonia sp.]|nr:HEXXH motif domain-containing protein [Trebonia sp.]
MRLLSGGERSRRLALLHTLLTIAAKDPEIAGPLGSVAEMWDVLAAMQKQAPAEFDDIFMLPQIGMWIAQTLRRLHAGPRGPGPLWADVGHGFSLALAVAARAGAALATRVPCRDGNVMIPGVGMARLGGDGFSAAEAIASGSALSLANGHGQCQVSLPATADADNWWHLRQLGYQAPGQQIRVWLDDIDPYRELADPIAPDRLPGATAHRWQQLFTGACDIFARDDPGLLPALAAGLASIVPLPVASGGRILSASSGDSSGSALVSLPAGPAELAVTLVHEFQHIKLGGVLHLLTLCAREQAPQLYAPWRDDPRPLSGLLQGVYAFLGVTDFWRRHPRASTGPDGRLAEFEFALWREHTWQALGTLRAEAGLTDLGRRFAEGMSNQVRGWWEEPVRPDVLDAVWLAANDHRVSWRIRHVRPDAAYVATLARAVRRGGPVDLAEAPAPTVIAGPTARWPRQRASLARMRIVTPGAGPAPSDLAAMGLVPDLALLAADKALVSGDHPRAVQEYADVIAAAPQGAGAWAGLILALAAREEFARPLLRHPELLVAVYRELRATPAALTPPAVARLLTARPDLVTEATARCPHPPGSP